MEKEITKTGGNVASAWEAGAATLRGLLTARPNKRERGLRWLESASGLALATISRALNRADRDVKLSTVERMAGALGHRVELRFVPIEQKEARH